MSRWPFEVDRPTSSSTCNRRPPRKYCLPIKFKKHVLTIFFPFLFPVLLKDNIFLTASSCRLRLRLVYWPWMSIGTLFLVTQFIVVGAKMLATKTDFNCYENYWEPILIIFLIFQVKNRTLAVFVAGVFAPTTINWVTRKSVQIGIRGR